MRAIYAVEIESAGRTWVSRYFHRLQNARRWALRWSGRVVKIVGHERTEIQ